MTYGTRGMPGIPIEMGSLRGEDDQMILIFFIYGTVIALQNFSANRTPLFGAGLLLRRPNK
jgi:hypothetical protein